MPNEQDFVLGLFPEPEEATTFTTVSIPPPRINRSHPIIRRIRPNIVQKKEH